MKTIWYRVMRLLHPITLAVILVGIAGFLLGLIVAVERQDTAIVGPRVDAGESSRIARLETALAGRDSEVAELQAELAQQRAEAPSPAETTEVESRIADLEAALMDKSTGLNVLQSELDELSGQLAEAIQARDELHKEGEQAAKERDGLRQELEQATNYLDAQREESAQVGRDRENERASFEQSIAGLRSELEATQERARAPDPKVPEPEVLEPEVAGREESSSTEAAAAETQPVTPEPPAVVSSASAKPAVTEPEEPKPPADAEPEEPKPQSAAAPPPPAPRGPISQGIAAYRAADYRKAYALWLPPALNGSPRAQFFIGALYYEGRGVPADLVLSYMWLRAATRKDDPGAIKLLDKIRGGMSGPELAEAETRIANGETIPAR